MRDCQPLHRLLSVLALVFFAFASCAQASESVSKLNPRSTRPNIVFILTDDMSFDDVEVMPNVKKLLADQGAVFANYFVTNSLCCPSRASILRGQLVHNHRVVLNEKGFELFHDYGHEQSTIATWLGAAGYRTALSGKYLNGYALKNQENYVPPGWDEWNSPIGRAAYHEFNYRLNENGKIVSYGGSENDYLTDVLLRKATAFIHRTASNGSPFFLYLATYAPHQPATPAPRQANLYPGVHAPRSLSFDESDVSAKPAFIRNRPRLTDNELKEIDQLYRKRLQSLRAVDELVAAVVEALARTDRLRNTYIVFSSDNGFHLGQHRLPWGKQTAYEEDIHVPLIIRGPGIAAGQVIGALAMEIDLAPTFAEWSGAAAPSFVDGRSLVPLLHGAPGSNAWRNGVLIEQYPGPEPFMSSVEKLLLTGKSSLPQYAAVRSQTHLYVEYKNGEREFYDLKNDPAELFNLYKKADPELIQRYSSWLAKMKSCQGAVCRQSEESMIERKPLSRQRQSAELTVTLPARLAAGSKP